MRAAVCFAVSPDLEMLAEEDWVVADNQVDLSFVKRELSTYDESALELGLRIADSDESAELTGLHVGGDEADMFMRKIYALRYHRAVRIAVKEDLRFSPWRRAGLLADYLKENRQDVIITGGQDSVGNNAQMPLMLAEILSVPCITQVIALRVRSDALLQVTSQADDGEVTQVVRPPILLAVGNTQQARLRVPTLKDRMKYGKQPVAVLPGRPKSEEEPVELKHLKRMDTRRAGRIIDAGTPEEKAQLLYDQYLKGRLEEL